LWYAEAKAWMAGDQAHAEFAAKLVEDGIDLRRKLKHNVFLFERRKTGRPSKTSMR